MRTVGFLKAGMNLLVLRKIKYNRVYIFIIISTFILISAATAIAANITLSWVPPLSNEDGTTLTDLAGYKIYYGTSSGDYMNSIDAGNLKTYQISGLLERLTYYFTVTAYDTSGNESMSSNEVARYIPQSPIVQPTVVQPPIDELSSPGQTCEGTGVDCPDYIDIYADLYECDLSGANLFVADLSYACMHGAILTNANLHGASLMYTDLSNADMRGAYMRFTDLTGANLNGADLTGAVLDNVIWWNTYCPDGTNSRNNNNTCAGHLF